MTTAENVTNFIVILTNTPPTTKRPPIFTPVSNICGRGQLIYSDMLEVVVDCDADLPAARYVVILNQQKFTLCDVNVFGIAGKYKHSDDLLLRQICLSQAELYAYLKT